MFNYLLLLFLLLLLPEGSGKPGGTEIEWDTSTSGLC
jgi:hypothetical protein